MYILLTFSLPQVEPLTMNEHPGSPLSFTGATAAPAQPLAD